MNKQRISKKLIIFIITVSFILLMTISGQATDLERAKIKQRDVPKTSDIERTQINPQEKQTLDQIFATIMEALLKQEHEMKKNKWEEAKQAGIQKKCEALKALLSKLAQFYGKKGCDIPSGFTDVNGWCDKSEEVISAVMAKKKNLLKNCAGLTPQEALSTVNAAVSCLNPGVSIGTADTGKEMNTNRPVKD